jgi:superoxide dismutase, Fe-Mn family
MTHGSDTKVVARAAAAACRGDLRYSPPMPSRRDFLELTGGAIAAVTLSSAVAGAAPGPRPPAQPRPAQPPRLPPPPPGLAPGAHAVRELPFQAGKLTGISAAMITSHHANNYGGAVKNLNKVELELAKLTKDTPGFQVAALRERELTYTNSMILHELYFGNLGGDGAPSGAIERRLGAQFGSAARWEELFRATAHSLGGGSGWVILDLCFATGDLRIHGTSGHNQAVASGQPLLVLDMFEHAYAMDFGATHARYVDAFFKNVAWAEVERRLQRADAALAALRG